MWFYLCRAAIASDIITDLALESAELDPSLLKKALTLTNRVVLE